MRAPGADAAQGQGAQGAELDAATGFAALDRLAKRDPLHAIAEAPGLVGPEHHRPIRGMESEMGDAAARAKGLENGSGERRQGLAITGEEGGA